MWIFTWDLVVPIDNIDLVTEKVFDSDYCEAYLYYQRSEGLSNTKNRKIKKKSLKRKEYEKLLLDFSVIDSYTLDFNYLEEKNFSRFILKGFKIRLPFSDKFYESKVLLTISNLGIASFTFWIHIEEDLNSKDIVKLETLPASRQEFSVELPIEIIKELSELEGGYAELLKTMTERWEKTFIFKNMILDTISFYYWIILNNVITNRRNKSMDKITKKIEFSHKTHIFPFLLLKSTEPEYNYADEMISKHPGQLYQILSSDFSIDYNKVTSKAKSDILFPIITNRRDVAFINSESAAILIIKGEKLEFQRDLLEAFIILEIIQIQKHFNISIIEAIKKRTFSKVNLKKVSNLRYLLSTSIDIYERNLAGNSIAKKRLDHGRDILEIEGDFKKMDKRMETLSEVLNNFYSLRTNFYQIALALILGVVPTFTILLPLLPIFNVIYAIGITVGIILVFYFLSKIYWARQSPAKKYEKPKIFKEEGIIG